MAVIIYGIYKIKVLHNMEKERKKRFKGG